MTEADSNAENKVWSKAPENHAVTDVLAVTEIEGAVVLIQKWINIYTADTIWVRVTYISYQDL